jgi:hypothetical protein
MSERWGDPPDEFEPWQFQFQLGTLLVAVFFLALLAAIWRMSALAGLAATGALLGLATNAVRGANSAKWLAIGALWVADCRRHRSVGDDPDDVFKLGRKVGLAGTSHSYCE